MLHIRKKIMDDIYVCRKTYTNGVDDNVKEIIFCLTVFEDKQLNKYRVANITNHTIWEDVFKTRGTALDAIRNGAWKVIQTYNDKLDFSTSSLSKLDVPI